MNVANVNAFITILVGKLTQYDDRQNKKHYNAYRLSHYLEAANKVRTDCSRAAILQRDDPEAMLKLEASIRHHFIADSMPPAKSTLKQIHEWLTLKKLPKYPTGYKYDGPGPERQKRFVGFEPDPSASPKSATRPAPNGNALGSMLHKGASKIASLVTGKRGR